VADLGVCGLLGRSGLLSTWGWLLLKRGIIDVVLRGDILPLVAELGGRRSGVA
jgi:hypothetical protein